MMTIRLLLFLIVVLSPATSLGQAYCSLRDPVAVIQASFSDFDHYRSNVRVVDETDRTAVLESLGFSIHENELVTHTLYTVFSADDALLGVIHVRTERGRWGLNEIAWVLNVDLEVVGMHLQRSRDRYRSYIESEDFQKKIRGKNVNELKALLTEDGGTIQEAELLVPDEARELAASVIRSALKTISVTQAVWQDSLQVSNK